jgi:DNA processing protein
MQATEAWLALACAQVGARAGQRMLEAFQHPAAIFAAAPGAWSARAKLSPEASARLVDAANRDLEPLQARMDRLGIRLITWDDPDYPALLRAIPDPPVAFFVKGALQAADARAVGIVGSRRASPYGRHVAAELAAGLAGRGITVVSGLALGADAAAHDGCLRAGGRTLAVLGCGVDVVYPPEHAELYERVAAHGAIISEFPPGAPATRFTFPVRNRIISGLSLGVVIVEAPEKSGALITAAHALEQGREVFAVPGSVNSVQSKGSHQLLRDGAKLVESVQDILDELPEAAAPRTAPPPLSGPRWDDDAPAAEVAPPPPLTPRPRKTSPPPPPPPPPALPPEEDALLRRLSTTARHVDQLIEETGLPPAQVNATLLMLELKGLVQRRPGNQYIRLV